MTEINPDSADTIPVDASTIRQTIINIRRLLKTPHSPAAQSMAQISAKTLHGYLPETLEAARKELEAAGSSSGLP